MSVQSQDNTSHASTRETSTDEEQQEQQHSPSSPSTPRTPTDNTTTTSDIIIDTPQHPTDLTKTTKKSKKRRLAHQDLPGANNNIVTSVKDLNGCRRSTRNKSKSASISPDNTTNISPTKNSIQNQMSPQQTNTYDMNLNSPITNKVTRFPLFYIYSFLFFKSYCFDTKLYHLNIIVSTIILLC